MATSKPGFGTGLARSVLGQGVGMSWGDEGEAWLRSKMGEGGYEDLLKRIRQEQATFEKDYPFTSGAGEFVGAAAPAVGMMFVPGMQPFAGANVARTTAGVLGRLAGASAVEGAVSGAGAAEEGGRGAGAVSGGVVGGLTGAAVPVVGKAGGAGYRWLRDRLAPGKGYAEQRAAKVMTDVLREEGKTPADVARVMQQDRARGIPSVVANVDPALVDLAETVAQRSSTKGSRKVEQRLKEQKTGSRERTYSRVKTELKPGDYHADLDNMTTDLRNRARTLYDDAYAFGDVDDPRITEILKHPDFQSFYRKAREIADTEKLAAKLRGEDPSKFDLPEIYKPSGRMDEAGNEILELVRLPDVRTLDYIKRGIDSTIRSGFKGEGTRVADANALRQLRREYVNAIDEATGGANSPYRMARQSYAGDMEVIDALEAGRDKFTKMDHEEIVKLISGMSEAERQAFRTGAVRSIYDKLMTSSQNRNAARELIGSPEMAAKLQPLFDNPGQFRLFQAALEREQQLFDQAGQVLASSRTAKRRGMTEAFEGSEGVVGDALMTSVTGSPTAWGSLLSLIGRASSNLKMSDDIANRLADMLMSRDPREVASVVQVLENYAAGQAPRATKAGATAYGVSGGISGSWFPGSTDTGEAPPTMESELERPASKVEGLPPGPDIEEYLRSATPQR